MGQRDIQFGPQPTASMALADDWSIQHCRNLKEAIRISLRESPIKRTNEQWADVFGTQPGTFHLWINDNTSRRRNFPSDELENVPAKTMNLAVIQFLARKYGYRLEKIPAEELQRESRAKELEEQLQQAQEELAQLRAAG